MVETSDAAYELVGLIEFIETGLLSPRLAKRLGPVPVGELRMAVRELLDWLSLRGILRGHAAGLNDRVHPLMGRVLARLAGLSHTLCVPNGRLEYRVEVPQVVREELEDLVKERIWHPGWTGRGRHVPQMS